MIGTDKFVRISEIGKQVGLPTAIIARACSRHGIEIVQWVPGGRRMLSESDYARLLDKVTKPRREA